jgi:hypothetical protein
MKDGKKLLIAPPLFDDKTSAYIAGEKINLTWLLII